MAKNCLYCNTPTEEKSQLCSKNCRIKWEQKEEQVFIQNGSATISKPLPLELIQMQQEFLKRRVS